MRESKFRGYAISELTTPTQWLTGYGIMSIEYYNGTKQIYLMAHDHETRVKKESVGQYIGLHDKNGKDIYEGDIVECKDLCDTDRPIFHGVVGFANASFMITDGFITNYRWMDYEVEVVGNKFENPEMIEEEVIND